MKWLIFYVRTYSLNCINQNIDLVQKITLLPENWSFGCKIYTLLLTAKIHMKDQVVIHEIDDMTFMLSLIGKSDAVTTIPLFPPSLVSPTTNRIRTGWPPLWFMIHLSFLAAVSVIVWRVKPALLYFNLASKLIQIKRLHTKHHLKKFDLMLPLYWDFFSSSFLLCRYFAPEGFDGRFISQNIKIQPVCHLTPVTPIWPSEVHVFQYLPWILKNLVLQRVCEPHTVAKQVCRRRIAA